MTSIIILSDTHIVAEGALAYGHSDTAAALMSAITTINTRLPELGPVEGVLVTGDLTDFGTEEEYRRFATMMQRLALPWWAIPGNHDRRGPMRSVFAGADWLPASGEVNWQRSFGDWELIALDTLREGAHHGELGDEGLAFLDAALSRIGTRPALVATHHPWMASGISAMDADNLHDGAALMARLEAHPGPVRMISGHVHRTAFAQIGRVPCQIVPAPCHAVHLDRRAGAENCLALEPGALTLISHSSEQGFTSMQVPVGHVPGPWPFGEV